MSDWKMNNPGCCGCVFCRKTEISDDECKLIVNRRRVTKIIWEIVSISDPWERFNTPSIGSYYTMPGTSALVGQYVVDLLTGNGTHFSPRGCDAQFFINPSLTPDGMQFIHPEFTEDLTNESMGGAFSAVGTNITYRGIGGGIQIIIPVLQIGAIDICSEIPETTYRTPGNLDRGSTTVWKLSHGFD